MSFTKEQTREITQMCMDGVSNAEIARKMHITIENVYAWRSQHHLTRADVAKLTGKDQLRLTPESVNARARNMYAAFCARQGGFDRLADTVCSLLEDDEICVGCREYHEGGDCSIKNCAPQLAKYLRGYAEENLNDRP